MYVFQVTTTKDYLAATKYKIATAITNMREVDSIIDIYMKKQSPPKKKKSNKKKQQQQIKISKKSKIKNNQLQNGHYYIKLYIYIQQKQIPINKINKIIQLFIQYLTKYKQQQSNLSMNYQQKYYHHLNYLPSIFVNKQINRMENLLYQYNIQNNLLNQQIQLLLQQKKQIQDKYYYLEFKHHYDRKNQSYEHKSHHSVNNKNNKNYYTPKQHKNKKYLTNQPKNQSKNNTHNQTEPNQSKNKKNALNQSELLLSKQQINIQKSNKRKNNLLNQTSPIQSKQQQNIQKDDIKTNNIYTPNEPNKSLSSKQQINIQNNNINQKTQPIQSKQQQNIQKDSINKNQHTLNYQIYNRKNNQTALYTHPYKRSKLHQKNNSYSYPKQSSPKNLQNQLKNTYFQQPKPSSSKSTSRFIFKQQSNPKKQLPSNPINQNSTIKKDTHNRSQSIPNNPSNSQQKQQNLSPRFSDSKQSNKTKKQQINILRQQLSPSQTKKQSSSKYIKQQPSQKSEKSIQVEIQTQLPINKIMPPPSSLIQHIPIRNSHLTPTKNIPKIQFFYQSPTTKQTIYPNQNPYQNVVSINLQNSPKPPQTQNQQQSNPQTTSPSPIIFDAPTPNKNTSDWKNSLNIQHIDSNINQNKPEPQKNRKKKWISIVSNTMDLRKPSLK